MLNGYTKWSKEPNTICEGATVLTRTFHFDTDNVDKERLVRVYLPSTYDFSNPNKRFKTLYMFDGKNLFDDYTSFVGEWGVDESIEEMIRNNESEGYIVIGIDSPKNGDDRGVEMSPSRFGVNRKYRATPGYADKLVKFLFDVVKPDIDATFFTKPEREYTGVGGSSMGGLMAFYVGMERPEMVKYCLNFSPALFLFNWDSIRDYILEKSHLDLPNQFFYVGGKDFEKLFVESTLRAYNLFFRIFKSHERVKLIYDSDKIHHEAPWRQYFPIALKAIDN